MTEEEEDIHKTIHLLEKKIDAKTFDLWRIDTERRAGRERFNKLWNEIQKLQTRLNRLKAEVDTDDKTV